MTATIVSRFANSPSYEILYVDDESVMLGRDGTTVHINKVGDYELDVWLEYPNGNESDVVLSNPAALQYALDDLFEEIGDDNE